MKVGVGQIFKFRINPFPNKVDSMMGIRVECFHPYTTYTVP